MNPLKKEQKENIIERINFIEIELKDLDAKYKNVDWPTFSKDRDIRRNVERIAENVANACIDISKILLAGESTEMPGTYQEIVLKLGDINIVNEENAKKLAKLVRIRNILAHQYLDLEWEIIKDFIQEGPQVVKNFIESLK
jgi:uncharacterized protein YutE (UPF0331/DUF86 family)